MSTATVESAPMRVSTPTPSTTHGTTHSIIHSTTSSTIRRIHSPIGRIELRSDGAAITALTIESNGRLPADDVPENSDAVLDLAAAQLAEYFRGERTTFEVSVSPSGSAFQQAVWRELLALPYGTVTSYGELGRATGRAAAGRAVGGAVGANPIPIIIPCHRVLASDLRITGYSGGEGVPTKEWLLALEGIAHK